MSTASITQHSPKSSPLAPGPTGHYTANRSNNPRTPTSPFPHTKAQTPKPAVSRHGHIQGSQQPDASPNYFSLTVENAKSYKSSGNSTHVRANFSPPSSKVRSTAAISPQVVPLDQNPDFEAFRRQSDLRSLKNSFSFSLPEAVSPFSATANPLQSSTPLSIPPGSSRAPMDSYFSEDKAKSPKRTLSNLSSPYTCITDRPRRHSPASFSAHDFAGRPSPHLHLAQEKVDVSLPNKAFASLARDLQLRAETLPSSSSLPAAGVSADGLPFASPSHIATLLNAFEEQILLLDLRVSTQYTRSKIEGALNLCIPTTLLKRPAYNTVRLAETFKNPDHKTKFERWRSCQYIVVYDANATKPKDAITCVNMLKKFTNEGWKGSSYIVRGGFQDFAKQFPNMIHSEAEYSSGTESDNPSGLPPVIGGCPMPATKTAANPFFGNIRQNMDLIGGVGQISLKRPRSMSNQHIEQVPKWLRLAYDEKDDGKRVADKFLAIEKQEQKRMQDALSNKVAFGEVEQDAKIKIAGIEKGNKNRYNNIWPYEHSRVKLEGLHEDACDYVNASHVKSAWSSKRYIATQGPIPATFADFWNVVWQQDVRVILMLTAEMESGQLKAHNYWSGKQFGPLHLKFLSEHRAAIEPARIHRNRDRPKTGRRRSTNPVLGQATTPRIELPEGTPSETPYVTVRRFTLSHANEPFARMREITHLQYSNWPDFGAPAHPAHLLGLVEQTDSVIRASQGMSASGPVPESIRPVLVHCSAGCGRTGTFCTVDTVLDMIRKQRAAKPPSARVRSSLSTDVEMTSPVKGNSVDAASQQETSKRSPESDMDWLFDEDVDLVEKVVKDFRLQRLSMVQSLRQFVLCYESIVEWLAEQIPMSA